jgi:prepilin-type N-terminal cleavage/methylation domain-containing protein
MNRMNPTRYRFVRGFTLLELIIGVVILAILAMVIVPSIGGFRNAAQQTTVQQQQIELQSGLDAWASGEPIPALLSVSTPSQRWSEWNSPANPAIYTIKDPLTGSVRVAQNVAEARLAMMAYFLGDVDTPSIETDGDVVASQNGTAINFQTSTSQNDGASQFQADWPSSTAVPTVIVVSGN